MDGGELLRMFLAEVLVLKRRLDLSSFKPKRSGPFCFRAAVAKLMPSRVDRLDFGVKLRGWHPTMVYRGERPTRACRLFCSVRRPDSTQG